MVESKRRVPILSIILLAVGIVVGSGAVYLIEQPQVQQLSGQVIDFQNTVASSQNRITSVQNELSQANSQLSQTRDQLTQAQSQLSQTQTQLSQLQNLNKVRDSINVVRWFADCPDSSNCNYQVRVTNNNNFDVTLKQILISLVDNSGNQVSTGSYTTPVIIRAGNSVTITVNVTYPSNTAGVSAEVTLATPYGDVVVGTV